MTSVWCQPVAVNRDLSIGKPSPDEDVVAFPSRPGTWSSANVWPVDAASLQPVVDVVDDWPAVLTLAFPSMARGCAYVPVLSGGDGAEYPHERSGTGQGYEQRRSVAAMGQKIFEQVYAGRGLRRV